jgi:hypothetical protein
MRRIDKKKSIQRANLMVEQRYLQSKGLLNEIMYPVNAGGEKKMAFAEGKDGVPSNLVDKLKEAGVNPDDVETVTLITPEGKEIKTIQPDENLEEGKLKNLAMACIITAAGVIQSCSPQKTTFSMNSNVHGTEYTVDNKKGTDTITVDTHGGGIRSYKVTKLKDQQGNASGGVLLKEKPTDEEIAIYSFGITLREEDRSNPNASHDGDKVVDYSIENPVLNVDYSGNRNPANSIKDLETFKDAVNFIKSGGGEVFDNEMKKAQAKGVKGTNITSAEVISNY